MVCYVVEGTALVQEEGKPAQEVRAGQSVCEPADAVIMRFDNASPTRPMRFIAHYLLAGQEALIEMLDE